MRISRYIKQSACGRDIRAPILEYEEPVQSRETTPLRSSLAQMLQDLPASLRKIAFYMRHSTAKSIRTLHSERNVRKTRPHTSGRIIPITGNRQVVPEQNPMATD